MTNLKQSEFVPANSLEERLVEAAKDPGARPAFYRELLESDLLVLGFTSSGGGDGHFVAQVGDTVSIAHWTGQDGAQFIPVFSSMQRLREAISQVEKYLQLNARSLFEMTQGMPVVLNPGATYGKEFTVEEIRSLLDGSIFKVTQRHVVEQEQQVLLGQPSNYPHKLVEGLKSLFAQHREVESAYLAHIHNPASGEPAHTIIGIKAGGDISSITADAGMVAREVLPRGEMVDFIQIDTSSISRYMVESTEPFYVRR